MQNVSRVGSCISEFGSVLKSSWQVHSKQLFIVCTVLLVWVSFVLSPLTRVVAVQAMGFMTYLVLLYILLYRTGTWKSFSSFQQSTKWTLSVLSVGFILFFSWYINQFNFLPVWDSAGYWAQTLVFNNNLNISIHQTFLGLIDSINSSDYNQFLCWIFSLPVAIFPTWKATFFIEFVLVLLPGALIFTTFICTKIKVATQKNEVTKLVPVAFIVTLSSAIFTRPLLSGYLDCIPVIIFLCIIVAIFDDSFIKSYVGSFYIGIAITLTFMLRRWLLFGYAGLAVGSAIYWLAKIFSFDKGHTAFKQVFGKVLVLVAGVAIPLIFFPEFDKRTFLGNQSTAYNSWTFISSFSGKVVKLLQGFGYSWMVIALITTIILIVLRIRGKKVLSELLWIELSFLLATVVNVLIFWRVQDLGNQHWYIAYFFIAGSVLISTLTCIGLLNNGWKRILTICGICLLSLASLLQGLTLLPAPVSGFMEKTLGLYKLTSIPIEDDLTEKYQLVDFVDKRVQPGETVYFAAASIDLNGSVPLSTCLPGCSESPFPVIGADVDSRDGFNTAFFTAEYVVTSTPASYHLAPENEQVITVLSDLIQQRDSFIGSHYREIGQFQLSKGVKALVYQRSSDFTISDVEQLRDKFQKIYPEYPELFVNRFNAYIESLKKEGSSS